MAESARYAPPARFERWGRILKPGKAQEDEAMDRSFQYDQGRHPIQLGVNWGPNDSLDQSQISLRSAEGARDSP